MSEGTETLQNTEPTEPKGPSEVEIKAMESGWVPKDEYSGEEHKWVDAAEFLRRGELFKKIENQSKELKDVKKALDEMKKLHSQVREVEYKRALDTLREQKKTALLEGDADALLAVEDKIDLVKEQQKLLAQEPAPVEQVNPEFQAWTERNSWYESSSPMRAFADALGTDLARTGMSPSNVLKEVEKQVRAEFPNKFRNPNQDKPGAVEGTKGKGTSRLSADNLSDDERRVMRTFVRTGVMTEEQYIKELNKVKGV